MGRGNTAPAKKSREPPSGVPAVALLLRLLRYRRLTRRAGNLVFQCGTTTRSRYRIDDIFAKHGVVPEVRLKTPFSEIACGLVAAGLGCAVADLLTAREFTSRGVIVIRFRLAVDFQVAALHTRRKAPTAGKKNSSKHSTATSLAFRKRPRRSRVCVNQVGLFAHISLGRAVTTAGLPPGPRETPYVLCVACVYTRLTARRGADKLMFVQQQGLKLPARLPATSRIFIAKRKTKKSKESTTGYGSN